VQFHTTPRAMHRYDYLGFGTVRLAQFHTAPRTLY